MTKTFSIIAICLYICFGSAGCVVYQAGGGKIYKVTATTEEGIAFIELLNIKLLCKKVYGIFWTDFYRSPNCVFVSYIGTERFNTITNESEEYDIPGDSQYLQWLPDPEGIIDRRIKFIPLNQKFCISLGLKPKFNWWHKYGSLVLSLTITVVLWAMYIKNGMQTHGSPDWWAAIIILIFFLSFTVLTYIFIFKTGSYEGILSN